MRIFSRINVQSLPLRYPHMALVFSLEAQVPERGRKHQAVIGCMDEDGGSCSRPTPRIGQYPGELAFSPHHTGIPAQVLVQAVQGIDLGIRLPLEPYE